MEHSLEIVARLVVGAADLLTTMIIQIALIAVPRLVGVRETRIERRRFQVLDFQWGRHPIYGIKVLELKLI